MADRRVYVEATVRIIIDMNEGIDVKEVLDEMDYNFISKHDGADIVDTELINYEVEDSK